MKITDNNQSTTSVKFRPYSVDFLELHHRDNTLLHRKTLFVLNKSWFFICITGPSDQPLLLDDHPLYTEIILGGKKFARSAQKNLTVNSKHLASWISGISIRYWSHKDYLACTILSLSFKQN